MTGCRKGNLIKNTGIEDIVAVEAEIDHRDHIK